MKTFSYLLFISLIGLSIYMLSSQYKLLVVLRTETERRQAVLDSYRLNEENRVREVYRCSLQLDGSCPFNEGDVVHLYSTIFNQLN